MNPTTKPVIGISSGDLNGIGIELIIKTFSDSRILELCTPIIFASNKAINFYRKSIPEINFNYQSIKEANRLNPKQANVFNCWEEEVVISPGQMNETGGKYAVLSLRTAAQALKEKIIDGLVTAPIHKKNIQSADFNYTGHTPFLKNLFGANDVVMMMCAGNFRVALVTEHVPVSEIAKHIIKNYFPGPVTVILKKHEIVPFEATAGLNTIAVRMPASKIALDFIKECGVPIAAPSANRSGSPSPTSYKHVLEDFNGKVKCILMGPDSKYGIESTVIDCTSSFPALMRPGVIGAEELDISNTPLILHTSSKFPKSPGQKYKHYAPKAKVVIVNKMKNPVPNSAYIGFSKIDASIHNKLEEIKICDYPFDYAKNLFSFFRECDSKKIKTIYCQRVVEKGIGMAIMNRLKKASS